MSTEQIFDIIKNSITELNEELEYESLNNITNETQVFGGDDGIDSLSLVRLIVLIERDVKKVFDKNVELSDARAMSRRNSPYRSVESLVEFVGEKLGG